METKYVWNSLSIPRASASCHLDHRVNENVAGGRSVVAEAISKNHITY